MTFLLDVNVLICGIWSKHPLHQRAFEGIAGKSLAVCPLAELGFLRVSTDERAGIRATMEDARTSLQKFLSDRNVTRIIRLRFFSANQFPINFVQQSYPIGTYKANRRPN